MDSVSDRLRAARQAADIPSAAAAARRFGWTETTYAGHENGSRGVKPATLSRYAEAFGVSREWLAFGSGEAKPAVKTRRYEPRGFSEGDAAPLERSKVREIGALTERAAATGGDSIAPFIMGIDCHHFSILRGDVLLIDLKGRSRSGDLVLATHVDPITGTGKTLLRRLIDQALVGATHDDPIRLSADVAVMGKVHSVVRKMG